ncbi:MAG: hypothetical protein AAFP10_08300 [Pseudomonadota bacterium]
MTIKQLRVTCPRCNGSGYVSGYDYSTDGCSACGGSGSDFEPKKMKKGRGEIYVKFEVLKDKCEYCAGSGKLDCTTIEHGTGFFGDYRKEKQFRAKCNYCQGIGKQLIAIYRSKCDSCGGSGKQYYWKKGLFGTEYKKHKTCNKCSGSGKIDKSEGHVFKGKLSSILHT